MAVGQDVDLEVTGIQPSISGVHILSGWNQVGSVETEACPFGGHCAGRRITKYLYPAVGCRPGIEFSTVTTKIKGSLLIRLQCQGANLYDLSFTVPSSGSFSVISIPSGWDYFSNWDPASKSGSFDLFSLTPGAPPGGSDIPPGFSLSGFLFQFDTRIGPVPFTAIFVNPADPGNPLTFTGTSEPTGYWVYLPLVVK